MELQIKAIIKIEMHELVNALMESNNLKPHEARDFIKKNLVMDGHGWIELDLDFEVKGK